MIRTVKFSFLALLGGLMLFAAVRGTLPSQGQLEGDAVAGGRIYSNWMLALDLPPQTESHPLWANQSSNSRRGVVTWRCVECHGWDYKGAEGAYGPSSSHYTGFPGLGDAVGASQEEVTAWLDGSNNINHNFRDFLSPTALQNLVAFLRTQQVDADLMIDPTTGAALGDWEKGNLIYFESCEGCHGPRGDFLNFGSSAAPIYIGDLAISDPWRSVHAIRFGDPTRHMPGSEDLGWSLRSVADVLAYTQSLPRANPALGVPLPTSSIETQGQIGPIIWAGLGIFLLIGLSLGWDAYHQRNSNRRV